VEAAIVVVDAVAGVQVQTEKVWKFATEYNLPSVVVVNRLDRERADSSARRVAPRRLKDGWSRFTCRSARSRPSRASSIS